MCTYAAVGDWGKAWTLLRLIQGRNWTYSDVYGSELRMGMPRATIAPQQDNININKREKKLKLGVLCFYALPWVVQPLPSPRFYSILFEILSPYP